MARYSYYLCFDWFVACGFLFFFFFCYFFVFNIVLIEYFFCDIYLFRFSYSYLVYRQFLLCILFLFLLFCFFFSLVCWKLGFLCLIMVLLYCIMLQSVSVWSNTPIASLICKSIKSIQKSGMDGTRKYLNFTL